jgi:oxygen-independent coproporphyrinogen-3 oxidase
MCDQALDFEALGSHLGLDFRDYFAPEIERLSAEPVDDGLIEITDRGFRATDAGRLLIRNLAMHFDKYLKTGTPARYSKTV